MNYFIITSAIFMLINSSVVMADELEFPEKQATAREQILLGHRLKGYKKIKAFEAVKHYFPNDIKAIRAAKSGMADEYSFKFKNYKKAREIYTELLTTAQKEKNISHYLQGFIDSLKGDFANGKGILFLDDMSKKLPKYEAEMKITYCQKAIFYISFRYWKNADDVERIAVDTNKILEDILFDNDQLTIKQGMIIRHLLSQISIHKIRAKWKLRSHKNDRPKGNVLKYIISTNTETTNDFSRLPRLFSTEQLIMSEDGFNYLMAQDRKTFDYIIKYISFDIRNNKSLNEISLRALLFLDKYYILGTKKDVEYLNSFLENLIDETEKKKILNIKNKISLHLKSQPRK